MATIHEIKERPILFSAPMVRAILAGTKTQTRRVIKPHPQMVTDHRMAPWEGDPAVLMELLASTGRRCPYGQPGDRLWVREAWADCDKLVRYYADEDVHPLRRKRPSIHMPRWASRITLEVTGVRVERLQDISEADALAEGVNVHPDHHGKPRTSIYSPVQAYRDLWESINGPGSWDANPWVWVVAFERIDAAMKVE